MKKCLIVDDVEVTRFTSEQIVAALGLDVHAVASPEETRAFLQQNAVDIVLLDWHLRKISGLDLLKEIKSAHAQAKVVMFSGVEGQEKAHEALEAGADAFLEKPTTKDKVRDCLTNIGLL